MGILCIYYKSTGKKLNLESDKIFVSFCDPQRWPELVPVHIFRARGTVHIKIKSIFA